jgi:hypothetical protein
MSNRDKTNDNFFKHLEWTESTENLLISWADIASCYSWIYDQSYRKYSRINYQFTIPIIVLSTITGTVGVGINAIFPSEYVAEGQLALGAVNIFIGILGTLQNFFRYAQLSESHLSAHNVWSKLHREIKTELSIERKYRMDVKDFVRSVRQEYERLLTARPVIPNQVVSDFKKKFKRSDVIKPEILDRVAHTYLDEDTNIIDMKKMYFDNNNVLSVSSERSSTKSDPPPTPNVFTRKISLERKASSDRIDRHDRYNEQKEEIELSGMKDIELNIHE